ncbi:MAG: DUF3472 domain-containing protein [Gemmatimonadaceae bacterium]|nr:DUF3472 domain-containing protein [Gemmatimonadaceae bacterium]
MAPKKKPPEWRSWPLPAFDSTTYDAPIEPRVPAYTAYLTPDPDAVRVSASRPLTPFGRAGTRLTWYGQRTRREPFAAQIALTLPASESVALELTVRSDLKSETRRATATGTGAEQRVVFGEFVGQDTGYLQFELGLRDKRATSNVAVNTLLLSGPGAVDAHFNMDARRNAASVHLRYPTDSTALVTGFYTEVTAIDDPVQTYYMATGFSRGYFGMQVNSATERRIIFSVWDAANGTSAIDRSTVAAENHTQLVAKGDGVVAEVFGNEGTGGHSHLVYPWKTREPQKFFVSAAVEGSATVYSGYWYHPENRSWMLIASFRAAKDSLGLKRLYSFSENFGGSTGHFRRKALYGSQWIRLANGEWQELTTASFSHDPTGRVHRRDRFMGLEDGAFFLSHGGFRSGFTEAGTTFSRPATSVPPRIVLPSR